MTIMVASSANPLSCLPVGHLLLWCGLVALTLVLIVLVVTRWGRTRPLHTCAVLSLLAHVLLACLATIVRLVSGIGEVAEGPPIRVRIMQESIQLLAAPTPIPEIDENPEIPSLFPVKEAQPELHEVRPLVAEPFPAESNAMDATTAQLRGQSDPAPANPTSESISPLSPFPAPVAVDIVPTAVPAHEEAAMPPVAVAKEPPQSTVGQTLALKVGTNMRPHDSAQPQIESRPSESSAVSASSDVPQAYANRRQSDRLGFVERQGGSRETEAAVRAALAWFAAVQSPNGRWDARRFEAGQERAVLGHNRGHAGLRADTGVTGLALLSYLGAGYSHLAGEHANTVRNGLQFLIDSQLADGNLCGEATPYARMYCHSMASFALAEALAVSGDARLRPAVQHAVKYSVGSQNSASGGWRYHPGQSGDTSQLGWQLMALHSAELAGIKIPAQTWTTVERFVRSVARGSAGGLASYRPDGPPSRTMTAEALYCRQLLTDVLGEALDGRLQREASRHIAGELPGQADVNLYYWYYATLALHHQQHASAEAMNDWHQWNEAMKSTLLPAQDQIGPDTGSWSPNTVWGGYGGRIYSTALATLCLEVYYRYESSEPANQDWMVSEPTDWPINR